jgi:hypothetical protein
LGKPPASVIGNADAAITTSQPVTEKSIETSIAVEKEKPVNYPEGRFLINETKVIYAKKGISFLAIAKQYDVDLSKLFEFNEMKQVEEVDKDRLIYIQRKRKTGNSEFHIVQSGESLHDIAQLQAIRLESLIEYNWLRNDAMPASGEQLYQSWQLKRITQLCLL